MGYTNTLYITRRARNQRYCCAVVSIEAAGEQIPTDTPDVAGHRLRIGDTIQAFDDGLDGMLKDVAKGNLLAEPTAAFPARSQRVHNDSGPFGGDFVRYFVVSGLAG